MCANIHLISSVDNNFAIGYANQLLCKIPEDMEFFRSTTIDHPIIMGRNTFLSIGRVLPKRLNIVISKSYFDDYTLIQNIKKHEALNNAIFYSSSTQCMYCISDQVGKIYSTYCFLFDNAPEDISIQKNKKLYISLDKDFDQLIHNMLINSQLIIVDSIDSALSLIRPQQTAFVIGGQEIFNQFITIAQSIYLTKINLGFELADRFFPSIDHQIFSLKESIHKQSSLGMKLEFQRYDRMP